MADIAYLAFQKSGSEAVGAKWNNIINDTVLRNLHDDTATSLGWTGQYLATPAGALDGNTDNAAGSGDAAWADEAIVVYSGHYQGSSAWVTYRVDVGTGNIGEDFNVVILPSHPAIRSLDMRVNGSAVQTHTGVVNNTTDVYTFAVQPDASGYIDIEFKASDGSSSAYWRAAYVEKVAPASDTTPPTISSASVPTAGDTIAVQMSEAVQVGAGGSGGWTISLGDATISSAAVDGTDNTIINLTPSRTLLTGESFTIGYTQPGDGFQDQAATPNDLATLSGASVTNNSSQVAQVPGISAITVQKDGVAVQATDWEINIALNSDDSEVYSGTSIASNASGAISAINTTGGSVGDAVTVEGFSASNNYGFKYVQNLEDNA